jgi:flagellar hook protein FlgE
MSFETALAGLNAAAADLNVTGNNIANGHTVGFKGSRAEFADIFASSSTGVAQNAIGQGVRLSNVSQQFSQGQFDFTGNNLDLAVNGTGFFRMSDRGEISYTRAGNFEIDRDGYIVNASGSRLTGFTANNGTVTGALGELRINTGDVDPSASTEMQIRANMNAQAPAIADAVAFDAGDPNTYSFSTSTTVYDSLGRDHLSTFYFVKREQPPASGEYEWNVHAELADHPGPMVTHTVRFDDRGVVQSINGADPARVQVDFAAAGPLAGAQALSLSVDFRDMTQFGTPFGVTELGQNGYAAGQFAGLSIEPNGIVFARYTNGQSAVLGQVVLSNFASPQNLQQIGNTSWVETFGSGAPITGAADNAGLGSLQAGALEKSNVNITEQLVKMITAQRNYQANAKMISTQDSITQEILNIR